MRLSGDRKAEMTALKRFESTEILSSSLPHLPLQNANILSSVPPSTRTSMPPCPIPSSGVPVQEWKKSFGGPQPQVNIVLHVQRNWKDRVNVALTLSLQQTSSKGLQSPRHSKQSGVPAEKILKPKGGLTLTAPSMGRLFTEIERYNHLSHFNVP